MHKHMFNKVVEKTKMFKDFDDDSIKIREYSLQALCKNSIRSSYSSNHNEKAEYAFPAHLKNSHFSPIGDITEKSIFTNKMMVLNKKSEHHCFSKEDRVLFCSSVVHKIKNQNQNFTIFDTKNDFNLFNNQINYLNRHNFDDNKARENVEDKENYGNQGILPNTILSPNKRFCLSSTDFKLGSLNINKSVFKQDHLYDLSFSFKLSNTSIAPDFRINVEAIEKDFDKRTTCMIKNIPNKYTQKMLIDLLNEEHFGTFNFVYLRMDFKNKCNVGYAFVNFTNHRSIPSFYKKINGKGWKKFSSGKIAELAYASIQGLENLKKKFKRSTVMLEQESYRPKLFYSSGSLQGQEKTSFM